MVTRLNEKELKFLISDERPEGTEALRVNLSSITINEWIEEGIFAFVKRELQQYHNLKFGCLKSDKGCQYFFIFENNNDKALNRFAKFFNSIMNGEKIPIHKISPNKEKSLLWESPWRTIPNNKIYNSCPLF